MANTCAYKVIVKGKKNACYAFFGSMSCMNDKYIEWEKGTDAKYEMMFSGDCKWAVDSYCNNNYKGPIPVDLPEDHGQAYELAEDKWWYNTVQYRSEMFDVEVKCNSMDVEDIDLSCQYYEHWKSGIAKGGKCPTELAFEVNFWE